jgi:hypothetical protein
VLQGEGSQHGPVAATLEIGVDGDHVDLALWRISMEGHHDVPNDLASFFFGNEDVHVLVEADTPNRRGLTPNQSG